MEVYVWGFTQEGLEKWPPDLEPVQLLNLPVETPVVVHASKAVEFAERVESSGQRADGRLTDVIVYLPHGMSVPRSTHFEAVVTEDDWSSLRKLLQHPEQFGIVELVDEVPLRQLTRPVEVLDLQQLELPEDAKDHLGICETCQEAFREALRTRLRLRKLMYCPDPARLVAYIRGEEDIVVKQHVENCPLCEAQVEALRPLLAPGLAWWNPIVLRRAVDAVAGASDKFRQDFDEVQRRFGAVLDLFSSARADRWALSGVGIPRSIHGRSQPSASEQQLETASILQNVQKGEEIRLVGPNRQLTIGWDEKREAPYISIEGRGHRNIIAFRVEIRRGNTVLWAARTDQGRVVIPATAVEEAIRSDIALVGGMPSEEYHLVIIPTD